MKTPQEWDTLFNSIYFTEHWDTKDPYSEREYHHYKHTYNYEIKEKRLEIIKQIQLDVINEKLT